MPTLRILDKELLITKTKDAIKEGYGPFIALCLAISSRQLPKAEPILDERVIDCRGLRCKKCLFACAHLYHKGISPETIDYVQKRQVKLEQHKIVGLTLETLLDKGEVEMP